MHKDLIGKKFGRLLVKKRIGSKIYPKNKNDSSKGSSHHALWLCLCECGNTTECITSKLKNGNVVSCGCHKASNLKPRFGRTHRNWSGFGDISGTTWCMIKACAKQRSIDFDISIQEAHEIWDLQNGKCALTGIQLILCETTIDIRDGKQTASLDRIDSKQPYSKENCQWVHKKINQMKWDFDQDDFINLCGLVYKHNS